ncbi:MAG: hypothetical protein AUK26_07130 [Syntrophaceae bacterium CG2_30_58_14]|nr:MAG: hypothetical protein AUK26_07130 [Syntrophaceae bacterium CG2_30_58_14]
MYRTPFIAFALILLLLLPLPGLSAEKCVNTEGEAAIVGGDIPSAKTEAVARAKWAAIEQTVGTEVKAGSIVQDFTLVDEIIKTQVGGVVKSYNILSQENRSDTVLVRINACIEPQKAQEAVSALSLNNAVAVFIPARKPAARETDAYEETNILSETLIGKLTDQGYRVVDVAPTQAADAAEIEKAMKSGSTLTVRSLMYKFLSNVIIIGKVDYAVSTKKGEDIGYGISMPFNNVTVRITYRIVARNSKTGNAEILTAGSDQARGTAGSVEDAAAKGMESLAAKLSPVILDKIASFIRGSVKKVAIRVNGVSDLDTNQDIKGMLQQIVWVTEVEEKRMGEFVVGYPENSLYLANSLRQKGRFKIVAFTPYSLTLEWKP